MQTFSKENISSIPEWKEFKKKVNTQCFRVQGPFKVETSEGPLECKDGWLCLDARGYPYPVAADEHTLIYEPVKQAPKVKETLSRVEKKNGVEVSTHTEGRIEEGEETTSIELAIEEVQRLRGVCEDDGKIGYVFLEVIKDEGPNNEHGFHMQLNMDKGECFMVILKALQALKEG